MNKIKISILSIGIFISTVAFAQDQDSRLSKEERMEQRIDKFAKELELTADQKEQLTELRKNSFEKRQELRNDESLDDVSKKSAIKTLHKKDKEKMAEILTDEQAAKLKTIKKERRANYEKQNPDKEYKGKRTDRSKRNKMQKHQMEQTPVEK